MKTIYWYQAEVFELEYTKNFHGILEMKSCEHGLRADIILEDSKSDDETIIGICISREYDIEECHDYACTLLQNRDYCLSVWRNYTK